MDWLSLSWSGDADLSSDDVTCLGPKPDPATSHDPDEDLARLSLSWVEPAAQARA